MYSVTNSFGLNGLRGFAVAVEADVSAGLCRAGKRRPGARRH